MVQGNRWSDTDKTLFKNPYAQFLRLETDLTKTWQLSNTSQLVGHVNAGVIRCFGNTEVDGSPFSERFYAGGANSIRAFTVRSIGPGAFNGAIDGMGSFQRQFSYILQNGDLKLIANLEYRTRLFGNLGGALFLDAGNVWQWQDPEWTTDWKLRLNSVFDQIAVGTGVGLRYDLGFLVIRIDWGLALHMPYETSRSGYFNVDSFRDAQALHFAIGYPF